MYEQKNDHLAIVEKDVMHPPGATEVVRIVVDEEDVGYNVLEPGPIAWKAIILPLDQECLMKKSC